MQNFMKEALKEAFKGMRKNHGGPFGAVIVRKNKIISRVHNEVLIRNDPTAHAEINAIRKAAKKLGRFDLSDCVLYSSCEPCPMCLAAVEWAKIKKIYYGATRTDAEKIGFSDKKIYADMHRSPKTRNTKEIKLKEKDILKPFEEWEKKKDKKLY